MIVIARDNGHRSFAAVGKPRERLVEQLLRRCRRVDRIIHVPGKQNEIDRFVFHDRRQLVDKCGLLFQPAAALKRPAEMPIGRMQYAHAQSPHY